MSTGKDRLLAGGGGLEKKGKKRDLARKIAGEKLVRPRTERKKKKASGNANPRTRSLVGRKAIARELECGTWSLGCSSRRHCLLEPEGGRDEET